MKYSKEFKVGIVLVISAVVFVLGVRFFQDLPLFGDTYQLYTVFDDANGLVAGNPVRSNGVQIGAVDEVVLSPEENQVVVRFHLDGGYVVPEGSQTEVGGISALNSLHMKLYFGPASNPPIEEGGFVPPVPEPGLLGQLSERAPELVDELDALIASAGATLQGTEALLNEAGGEVPQTLQTIRSTTLTLQETLLAERARLGRVLGNLETLTENVNEVAVNVNELTVENRDSLAVAVQNLNQVLRRFDRNLAAFEVTTRHLDDILAKVDRGEGTLGLLVNDPTLYYELDSTVTNLNRILLDFQENPRRYLKELELIDVF